MSLSVLVKRCSFSICQSQGGSAAVSLRDVGVASGSLSLRDVGVASASVGLSDVGVASVSASERWAWLLSPLFEIKTEMFTLNHIITPNQL